MSSQNRESKSPIKSIIGLFTKEKKPKTDGPTQCILPPDNKPKYNPKTKRYEWEGQEPFTEEVIKPPPKKSELTQAQPQQVTEQQDYLKPQNTHHIRARQVKQNLSQQTQQIQKEFEQPKTIAPEIQQPQPQLTQPQLTQPTKQQPQPIKQQPAQQQAINLFEQENKMLKTQLMDVCNAYNKLVVNYDACNNFIQGLPQKLIPQHIINSQLQLISIQQPENIHLDYLPIQFNLIKSPVLVTVPPQIIEFPQGSNEYLTQIIQEQADELSDMVELIEQQSQDLQNKDLQIQQLQIVITDLLRKLDEFVNCSNSMKKQLEGQVDERKNYQQYIKQMDSSIKQQDLQIKNLQKEKEVYKRQVQNLQREKEMYVRYNEELRRQYDEDIQMMNSQLEQSQLLVNDQENIELRQIKEQLQFDLEFQKSEMQNLKQLLNDISNEMVFGFKFLANFEARPIETKLDIQTLCHQYRREFQKQILQKDQGHLQNIQDYKTQIFQINLQKSSLEQIVAQQEKQINNYLNDFVQAKKEIALVCKEYDHKIQEVNEYKQNALNELKQCEDQLFQTNLKLITQEQELQQQQRKNILEYNERLAELETDLISRQREQEFLTKQNQEKDRQNEKSSQEIKALSEQLIKLEQEKKFIENKFINQERHIEQEKKRLEQLKSSSENKIHELHSSNDKLSKQLNQLTAQYERSQLKESELQQQLEQQSTFIQEQEQSKSELETQIKQLEEDFKLSEQQLQNEYETKLSELRTQNTQEISFLKAQISEQNSKITELESTEQQLESIISQLNEQLSEVNQTESESPQLLEQLNSKEVIINQLNDQIQQLQGSLQTLQEELTNQSEKNQEYFSLVKQKNELITQQQDEIQQVASQNQDLQRSYSQYLKDSEQQLQDLQSQLENEIAQLKVKNVNQIKENQSLQDELSQLQNQIQNLKQQNEHLTHQVQNYHQSQTEESNLIDQQQLENIQKLEQENQELTDQIQKLVEEINVIDQERQQKETENEEIKRQYEQTLNTIAELRSKEYDETKLRQTYNQFQALQEELNNLKQLYASKLKVIDQLTQENKLVTQKEQEFLLQKDQIRQLEVEKKQLEQSLEHARQVQPQQTVLLEYQNYKAQTQDFIVEQNQKLQKMEQELSLLNSKILQITAQRDEYKEQVEFKQKNNPPPKPSGFVGKLAGFFATESELKKLAQGQ